MSQILLVFVQFTFLNCVKCLSHFMNEMFRYIVITNTSLFVK